jgi:hypothetical protein
MSVLVRHVHALPPDSELPDRLLRPVIYVIVEGTEDCEAFKKLVQQGSCLEPNLSPAMKELADLVTSGKIQQPYREMPK